VIDIHSHILPGLDDGARSFEEAMQMLRLAAESGTTDIVATPHISPAFPNSFDRVSRVFDEVSQSSSGIVRLHLGCDFHLTHDNLQHFLANPTKYTINNRQYLMVELSDYIPFGPVDEALSRISNEGVTPVITHPERNHSLQRNGRQLACWVDRGCLCQITGQSLLGRFGSHAKDMAQHLLKSGLAHVVASDGHDLINRPPTLEHAYRYIVEHYGRPLADQLCVANPTAIILGQPLPPAVAKPVPFWTRLRRSRWQ
jgi:protein-tyrosine phosphatase